MSLQLLVILVPLVFGFLGFAFDLGRMYLIRGEMNQAATEMALAAAAQLIGTTAATGNATAAANVPLGDTTGHAARFNFGSTVVGATQNSEVQTPGYYSTLAAALGGSSASADQADGTTARHVQINLTAQAPLLFWSLLTVGQSRNTPVAARAVAGLSAPVCTACSIEPFAIQALNSGDTTDFGFTAAARYTFAYNCSGTAVLPLTGTSTVVSFMIIDRYTDGGVTDESQQLYRIGAAGLMPNISTPKACVRIGALEAVWGTSGGTNLTGGSCSAAAPALLINVPCGIYSRFATDIPGVCQNATTDVGTLAAAEIPDTDLNDLDDYTSYAGNLRRILTVPVVDSLNGTSMSVLGFRQFLVEPNQGGVATDPTDSNARFVVLYLGTNTTDNLTTPVPLKQGRLDGCQNGATVLAGPGKVVLHQ